MKYRKIFLGLVLGVVLCGLECGCQSANTNLVIGGVLPMTGDAGTFGQNAAKGAELAIRVAKGQNLVSKSVELKVEDSRGLATEAVSAARKLIDVDHASLLIGDVTSAGTQALIPVITNAKVPLISPAASDPKLSNSSPFFARVWPSDVYEANVIGGYANKQGFKKIAVIYANTDYGTAMVDQFKKVVPSAGLVISVDRETLDYRPTIQRIRLSGADALFLVLYPEDASRMLQQLAEQRIVLPMMATATFEDPKLLASPGAERVVFASPVPPDANNPQRKKFLEDYKSAFGVDAGVLSDTGYDAAMILLKAYAAQGPKWFRSGRRICSIST